MEAEELPYTEEDIENLKKIFSLFDKDSSGMIEITDMHELMKSLGKSNKEAHAIMSAVDSNQDDKITFDEFIKLLATIESTLSDHDPLAEIQAAEETEDSSDPGNASKVVEFLSTLERHRRKCEEEGRYEEAKIARLKFEEVRGAEVSKKLSDMRMQ